MRLHRWDCCLTDGSSIDMPQTDKKDGQSNNQESHCSDQILMLLKKARVTTFPHPRIDSKYDRIDRLIQANR